VYRIITVLAITLGTLAVVSAIELPGSALPMLRRAGAEEAAAPSSDAKATALKAFQRGTAHYNHGEYDKAIEQFQSGYQAVPQAVFLYNIAQAHRAAGRADQALSYYRQYLQQSPDAKNRPEIEERIAALEKEVGPAPTLLVPSSVETAEPAPAGLLTPVEEQKQADKARSAKRKRTAGIVVGVIGGLLVVGAAVGLGLYFGLPRSPDVTVFQPVTP
jgi:tetratricopeptide (TPR) repeat protein